MSMKLLVTMAIIRRRRKEESKGYIKAKALKKDNGPRGHVYKHIQERKAVVVTLRLP